MTRRSLFLPLFTFLFPQEKRVEFTIGRAGHEFYVYWTDPDGTWQQNTGLSLGEALSQVRNLLIADSV